MEVGLIFSSFVAGMITFLAPCTLPLVPGYLAFISGVPVDELAKMDKQKNKGTRRKIFWNGLLYVIGFSAVFILLGTIFGLTGAALGQYKATLAKIGGVFVIFFGLFLIGVFKWRGFNFLNKDHGFNPAKHLKPGKPVSSLVFGATFAFGWTPCVGPILGSILFLASSTGTVFQGAFLLVVFSMGLGIPFLLVAALVGTAMKYLKNVNRFLPVVSKIGGVFLVVLGLFLISGNQGFLQTYLYSVFSFINYDSLLDYL